MCAKRSMSSSLSTQTSYKCQSQQSVYAHSVAMLIVGADFFFFGTFFCFFSLRRVPPNKLCRHTAFVENGVS